VTDTVTVYTNMSDAKAISYAKYYAEDAETDTAIGPNIGNAADRDGVTSADSAGVLLLDITDVMGNSKLFSAASFPSGDRQTFMFTDDATTATIDERKFDGMFNGVAGEYACTDSTCTATTDKDGDLITLTGAWSFTPSAKDLTKVMIPGVNHDANYLSFGYWVRATEKDDGSTAYGIGTFTTGVPMFTAFSGLEGTAKYAGKAAGMYAKKTLTPSGGVDTLTTGHFTADANLVASFEGDTVAVADHFSVTGTVSNFDDASSGNRVDSAWMVELGKGTVNQDTGAIADGTTTGQGEWAGQFYGTPDTTVTDTAKQYPSGVAGEFDGHFANGHVLGAFGATRQ
jgi:hypothetical protein